MEPVGYAPIKAPEAARCNLVRHAAFRQRYTVSNRMAARTEASEADSFAVW
jgi:hypothetical protein